MILSVDYFEVFNKISCYLVASFTFQRKASTMFVARFQVKPETQREISIIEKMKLYIFQHVAIEKHCRLLTKLNTSVGARHENHREK